MKLTAEIPHCEPKVFRQRVAKLKAEGFRWHQEFVSSYKKDRWIHAWTKEAPEDEARRLWKELFDLGIICRITH